MLRKGLPLLWLVLFTTTFCNPFRIDFYVRQQAPPMAIPLTERLPLSTPFHKYGDVCWERDGAQIEARRRETKRSPASPIRKRHRIYEREY